MLSESTWALASLRKSPAANALQDRTRIGASGITRKRAFPQVVSFIGVRGFDVPKVVSGLLKEIAALEGLSLHGKTQTAICRKSKPFLHFHWNEDGIVADVTKYVRT